MSVSSSVKLPGSPKRLSVKIKNKLNSVQQKKCKPEYRSTSLEGWSGR